MYQSEKTKKNSEEKIQTAYYEIIEENENEIENQKETDLLKPRVTIYRKKDKQKKILKKSIKDSILTS